MNTDVNLTYNDQYDSIDIRFPGKPSGNTLSQLKAQGFRWSTKEKIWHAKKTDQRDAFAQSLASGLPCNQILGGACADVMRSFPDRSADLVVTDPPYLVGYKDRSGRSIQNDVTSEWIEPSFSEVFRVLKNNRFCISFYGWNNVEIFMTAWKKVGFRPVGHIVWHKSYASSNKGFLGYRHEQAFLLAKGRPSKPAKPLPDVLPWAYSGNHLHPTEKSVKVIAPLIESFSQENDLVIDPFCGSGTTAVAAKKLGRRYIGIDLEPEYVNTARGRLS
ncbi:MAG: DNA methyltransferase [Amphritea sp.]